jgi:hypothetical protein
MSQEVPTLVRIEFFCMHGKRLDSKVTLEQEIHEIIKIPTAALR